MVKIQAQMALVISDFVNYFTEEASVYRTKEELPFHCMLPPENNLKRKLQNAEDR